MSVPTMPPPPPGAREEPVMMPAPEPTSLGSRPAWRQGRPGWALLHLLIATGVWFAGLLLIVIVLAAAGRTEAEVDRVGDQGVVALFLAAAFAGWFLFAYSAGSTARRWAIFGCVTGGAWLIMLAVVLNASS